MGSRWPDSPGWDWLDKEFRCISADQCVPVPLLQSQLPKYSLSILCNLAIFTSKEPHQMRDQAKFPHE